MSNLWPRIEPLLARVEKPARYIGMERGARRRSTGPARSPGSCIYPDTYEIGLPNQGLQILYEILNERDDAVAERAYAPWVDFEASMLRASGVPLFSVDTHRAAADFDVLAFNLSAELVYTNVLNCIDLAGVPVRAEDRAARPPARHRGRPLHLQPRAAGRLRRRVRDRRRRRGRQRDHRGRRRVEARRPRRRARRVLRDLATITGVYVPSLYDVEYDGPRAAGDHAAASRRARRRSRSAPSPTSPTGRTRRTSSCRSSRSCTTGSTSRSSGAARAAAASARPG